MKQLPKSLLDLSREQRGLLSRKQLATEGINSHYINRRIGAGLWQDVTSNVVALHNQPVDRLTQVWAASLHHPQLALTGAAALELIGLKPELSGRIDLIGPRGTRLKPTPECRMHTSREDLLTKEFPHRTDMPFTVAFAMREARSDKQAALYACVPIQKGLTNLDRIGEAVAEFQQQRYRPQLKRRFNLLVPGTHSIPELEFAMMCRKRGLPEPVRQRRRFDSRGNARFTDCEFIIHGHRVIVEIDGFGHLMAEVLIDDSWRANELTLQGDIVLRISSLALRLQPDPFFDQLQQAFQKLALKTAG